MRKRLMLFKECCISEVSECSSEASLGPYKYYVAIPLTHLHKFKARMRLQSCGLLCVEAIERLTERELEVLYLVAALQLPWVSIPSKVPTTPLFSRWPEQSVLGQQTVVSGHLEFSLKTTAT